MPRFHFRALDEKGETVVGELDAFDERGLISKLREQQQMPLEIQLAGTPLQAPSGSRITAFLNMPFFAQGRLRPNDLTVMTRELATLMTAGLPLDQALAFLSEVAEKASQKQLIDDILDAVRSGSTLADALDAQGTFSASYVSLVRAGEAGNALDEVLTRLATFLDQNEQLRQQVTSALVYPAILLVMSILSVMVLLTLVLPQFTPLFDQAGAELPLLTQIVMAFGDIVQSYWWLMLLFAFASPIAWQLLWREPASRARIDRFVLKLPLAGDLATKADTATLTRTVGTLLTSGVALPAALRIATEAMTNSALRAVVGSTTNAVKEGKGIAGPLAESKLFPKLATHLIAVGEKSGQLEMMLLQISSIFDREVKTSVDRLMTLLVPVLTIAVGLVIAVIIGAILSAILASYQLPI